MDIAALSTSMSMSNVQNAVGISVLKMAMDSSKQTSAQMNKLMESSNMAIDPNLGQNLDVTV